MTIMAGSGNSEPTSWLLNLPATSRQRLSAIAVAAALIVGFFVTIPSASMQLPRLDAFIPSVQTGTFLTDTITAVLLYAQFSIYGSLAILVLASGYLFTALLIILHVLSFPGAFSPTGLLGSGLQTTAIIYDYWHIGFMLILMAYAWLRYGAREKRISKVSTRYAIFWSVVLVICLVGGLVSFAIARDDLMPRIYLDRIRLGPAANYEVVLIVLTCLGAFVSLWPLRRFVFDQWLMVVVVAALLDIGLALLGLGRYTVGFYADRVFAVSTATIVLIVLLAETMRLDARLASANMMLQREQNTRLMNLDAVTASVSHELKQPLAAIMYNTDAAIEWLKRAPPDLGQAVSALEAVSGDTDQATQVVENIRALFGKVQIRDELVDVNVLVLGALRVLRETLNIHDVSTQVELAEELPPLQGHRGQLQEVIINLVQNAVEAMEAPTVDRRILTIRSARDRGNNIAVDVEDTGPGIAQDRERDIFEAFVTTKPSGMGLGLAICRTIIDRHQGQLLISQAKPRGTIFRVILPLRSLR
jgi:signal transduction histidine kinase